MGGFVFGKMFAMNIIYFYSMGMPSEGSTGLISINNGTIAEIAGTAKVFVSAYRKSNPAESDQKVFDYFSDNWTDGNTFTLPMLLTGDEVKDFLGF